MTNDDFSQLFNKMRQDGSNLINDFLNKSGYESCCSAPIYEEDGKYFAEFEVPGYRNEELTLEIANELLKLSANNGKRGKYTNTYDFPKIFKKDIAAKLENGVLKIEFFIKEEEKPIKIEIK